MFASCPRPEALPLVGDPCLPLEGAPPTTARTRWHATSTSSCSDGCVPPVASACTDAPIASPGGQPTPGLARWAYPSSVARRTHSRTPRSLGGPQACVWPPRRPRGRPPSRRSESWGCTSTSVPSFPKGRSHLCTRCYESETVAGVKRPSTYPYSPKCLEGEFSELPLLGFLGSSAYIRVGMHCAPVGGIMVKVERNRPRP